MGKEFQSLKGSLWALGEHVPLATWTWVELEGSQAGALSEVQGPHKFPVCPGRSMVLLSQPDFFEKQRLTLLSPIPATFMTFLNLLPPHSTEMGLLMSLMPSLFAESVIFSNSMWPAYSICHCGPLPSGLHGFLFPPQTVPSCSVCELSFLCSALRR